MNILSSSEVIGILDRVLFYGLVGLAFLLCFNAFGHISEYFFLTLVGIWLLKIFYQKSIFLIPTPLDLPVLIYLGWIAFTLPFAFDPTYSLIEWRKVLPRFLMFWFVLQVVRGQSQVKAILHVFVIGLGALCLTEVVSFFMIKGDPFSMDVRAGSLFGAHQWLSNYLVIGGPFLWLSWVSQEYVWEKVVNGLVCGIYPLALFLVHTRSAWLVVLIQIGLFFLFRMTGKFFLSIGLTLCGVVLAIISLTYSGEVQNILSKNDFSNPYTLQLRFNTWNVALQDIQDSPIVGSGYGKHTFRRLHPNMPKEVHEHIHNMFLSSAFQLGIPGLALFLFLFLRILLMAHLWLKTAVESHSFNAQLTLAISLMAIGLMVRNCFDDMFHGSIVYLFLLLVALGFCLNPNRAWVWSWSKSDS